MEVDVVVPTHLHFAQDSVPGIVVLEHEAAAAVEITEGQALRVCRSYPSREVNWTHWFPAFLGGFAFALGLLHQVKIWARGQGSNRVRLKPTKSQFVPEWD